MSALTISILIAAALAEVPVEFHNAEAIETVQSVESFASMPAFKKRASANLEFLAGEEGQDWKDRWQLLFATVMDSRTGADERNNKSVAIMSIVMVPHQEWANIAQLKKRTKSETEKVVEYVDPFRGLLGDYLVEGLRTLLPSYVKQIQTGTAEFGDVKWVGECPAHLKNLVVDEVSFPELVRLFFVVTGASRQFSLDLESGDSKWNSAPPHYGDTGELVPFAKAKKKNNTDPLRLLSAAILVEHLRVPPKVKAAKDEGAPTGAAQIEAPDEEEV